MTFNFDTCITLDLITGNGTYSIQFKEERFSSYLMIEVWRNWLMVNFSEQLPKPLGLPGQHPRSCKTRNLSTKLESYNSNCSFQSHSMFATIRSHGSNQDIVASGNQPSKWPLGEKNDPQGPCFLVSMPSTVSSHTKNEWRIWPVRDVAITWFAFIKHSSTSTLFSLGSFPLEANSSKRQCAIVWFSGQTVGNYKGRPHREVCVAKAGGEVDLTC